MAAEGMRAILRRRICSSLLPLFSSSAQDFWRRIIALKSGRSIMAPQASSNALRSLLRHTMPT